jgi:hypothetical protein
LQEGLLIARLLVEETIGAAIEARAECVSACAVIFMGGSYLWIGQLNRFLHVKGTLGFHAPYVDPAKLSDKAYSGTQIALAVNSGIQAVNQMVKLGRGRVPHFFDADLLS